MKNILSNIFCTVLSVLSIAGGAVLFVKSFPEDLIWTLAGIVMIIAGTAAILSKITGALSAEKWRTV